MLSSARGIKLYVSFVEVSVYVKDPSDRQKVSTVLLYGVAHSCSCSVALKPNQTTSNQSSCLLHFLICLLACAFLSFQQSTSNYEARKFGVRAAMPGFIGKKLCPSLIIVRPNFDKYTAASREVGRFYLKDRRFVALPFSENSTLPFLLYV